MNGLTTVLISSVLLLAACGSDDSASSTAPTQSADTVEPTATLESDASAATDAVADANTETNTETDTGTGTGTGTGTDTVADAESSTDTEAAPATEAVDQGTSATYVIEIWADNWAAVYVDGQLVGEDSVPITTERSFNSETFTFEATLPFTVAIEAKDFKETDSGIEYIGEQNQQMGDGGLIAQVTDTATGEVVAVTDGSWKVEVVHRAPLNTDCVNDADPDATCEFEITETPADWAEVGFDDSTWADATEWSANAVDPKDGYNEISWDPSAQLIWGTDLEIDNTILVRHTVT